MSLLDFFKGTDSETRARRAESDSRQTEILRALRARTRRVPQFIHDRMEASGNGTTPWLATMTPAELRMVRSHGIRPIGAISATCWLHYGWSWTNGHAQGWQKALQRLKDEARAGGANAVLDVKMRTIPVDIENSMDFSLVGTAVKVDGLPPSDDPIVATVPALEFIKLLEADIVPTGIAVGADYRWITDWRNSMSTLFWIGNVESTMLSDHWRNVRERAYQQLRENTSLQGNGALSHVNFSEMFESETDRNGQKQKQYLARHIVIATVIDQPRNRPLPHDFQMVVDMHQGKTPLIGRKNHHQSYASNDEEGGI